MGLEEAYRKAVQDMRDCNPYVVAAKSGVEFEEGKFRLSYFNRLLVIHHPQVRIEEVGSKQPVPLWLELISYHYLVTADGVSIADEWITYRLLPGAFLFEQRFGAQATLPLVKAFGSDIEAFKRAGLALGGMPMSRTGDASFRFMALPRLPVACVLYLGDEEVSGSAAILFDKTAPHYLPTEDLSIIGHYLVRTLVGLKGS
ncbi:MAG: DUF3786 domain-containing protein [Chloroflexi bacterium]|nr:DUF3786 domain-containing protein [Chloroflexota bacterium]